MMVCMKVVFTILLVLMGIGMLEMGIKQNAVNNENKLSYSLMWLIVILGLTVCWF